MHPALPYLALLAGLVLSGCGGSSAGGSSADGYSPGVRENFLTSCVDNATNSASGATNQAQLTQTCECILGKVEQEYSEAGFAAFEKRLLSGEASEQERAQLVGWSTSCAQETTS